MMFLVKFCCCFLVNLIFFFQNAAARSILRTPRSEHISPLLQNLHWLPVNRRTLHKVAALCHSSLSGSGPQYFSDLTHVYTPARSLRCSSDTRILSTPNVILQSYGQRSFAYQGPGILTTVLELPGILCHSHSDINRNLIASSELWKLICFLSINELNTSVVFFYFHLPTNNTTLVITNSTHLSYYWH